MVLLVGRDCILKHARNLSGTSYFVSQQMPPEMLENKNKVAAIFRQAKAQGKRPRYVGKGDKVMVEGKTYSAPSLPLCDTPASNVIERTSKLKIQGSTLITERGNKFIAHMATVSTTPQIAVALSAIKHAHHDMYAARIATQTSIAEYTDDDGEHSGARHILREMQRLNIVNRIVVVTHWCNGYQLGRQRFMTIGQCSRTVLEKETVAQMTPSSIRQSPPPIEHNQPRRSTDYRFSSPVTTRLQKTPDQD